MNFKEISQLTKLLLKIAKNKRSWESLLITSISNIQLNYLTRVQKYMTPEQNTFLTSYFIKSQVNYCPLIWMFCLKKSLHRLNNIHERSLRFIHQEYVTILVNVNEKSIHQKCLEFLMIEDSDKLNNFENISLIEKGNLLADDFEISETFNKYFQNVVPNLDLKVPSKLLCQTPENGDEVLAAIYEYQNHPSIKTILEKCNFSFSFKTMSLTDIGKEMKSLNTNKAFHSSDIPTKILKQNLDFFSPFILGYVNKSISSSTFPSILKLADVIPVYKKDSLYEKSNYRPISVLPNLSKPLKMFCMTIFLLFLITFYLNIQLVSGKASIRKVVSWQ